VTNEDERKFYMRRERPPALPGAAGAKNPDAAARTKPGAASGS
jgi:hypothetical protein